MHSAWDSNPAECFAPRNRVGLSARLHGQSIWWRATTTDDLIDLFLNVDERLLHRAPTLSEPAWPGKLSPPGALVFPALKLKRRAILNSPFETGIAKRRLCLDPAAKRGTTPSLTEGATSQSGIIDQPRFAYEYRQGHVRSP